MPKNHVTLREIYQILLRAYGHQLWWPTTPKNSLTPSYSGGPSTRKQQLEVILGAVLTQNTSWKNVEKVLNTLHKHSLVNVSKLLQIPNKDLALLIRPSGYFNEKAKKLKAVARFLSEHPISQLEKIETDELREMLLGVKGIGPETADSILLYSFCRPKFVVDAYTKRIFSRLACINESYSYDQIQTVFETKMRRSSQTYNEYHALIVEHGKSICKPRPKCSDCVLNTRCPSRVE